MTAPKDSGRLYEAARSDLSAPTLDKMLKWIFWTAEHLRLLTEMQGRKDSADTRGRAAVYRDDQAGTAMLGAADDLVARAAELHSVCVQIRDLLIYAMATSRAPEAQAIQAPPATTVAFLPRNANGRTPQG